MSDYFSDRENGPCARTHDLHPTNRAVQAGDFRLQDGLAGTRWESGRPVNCAA